MTGPVKGVEDSGVAFSAERELNFQSPDLKMTTRTAALDRCTQNTDNSYRMETAMVRFRNVTAGIASREPECN